MPPLSALPAAQQPLAYQRRCCAAHFVSTNLGWLDEVSSMGRAVSHGLQKELVFLYVFLIHSLWFPWTGRMKISLGRRTGTETEWSLRKALGLHFLFALTAETLEQKADRW